jgi:hypothetical protein
MGLASLKSATEGQSFSPFRIQTPTLFPYKSITYKYLKNILKKDEKTLANVLEKYYINYMVKQNHISTKRK